ncbi:Apoptosis inhibitor 5, partial [Cladochytrium tenue]
MPVTPVSGAAALLALLAYAVDVYARPSFVVYVPVANASTSLNATILEQNGLPLSLTSAVAPNTATIAAMPSFPYYGLFLGSSDPATPVQLRSSIVPGALLGNFSLVPQLAANGVLAFKIASAETGLCLGLKAGYDNCVDGAAEYLRGWNCEDPDATLLYSMKHRKGSCYDVASVAAAGDCWEPLWVQKVVNQTACDSFPVARMDRSLLAALSADVVLLSDLEKGQPRFAMDHYQRRFDAILCLTEMQNYDRRLKASMASTLPRFFRFFPSLQNLAMDKHLDLCEDDDDAIRLEAIKQLPRFCDESPPVFSTKVADVLCQLLQTDSAEEYAVVKDAIMACWMNRPKATTSAMFHQLTSGIPEVKSLLLTFMTSDLPTQLLIPTSGTALSPPQDPQIATAAADDVIQFATGLTRWLESGDVRHLTTGTEVVETMFRILLWKASAAAAQSDQASARSLKKKCEASITAVVAAIEASGHFE